MDGFILSSEIFLHSNFSAMKIDYFWNQEKQLYFERYIGRTYKNVNGKKKTHQVFCCCFYSYCLDSIETGIDFDQESGLSERHIHSSKAPCHLKETYCKHGHTHTKKSNFAKQLCFRESFLGLTISPTVSVFDWWRWWQEALKSDKKGLREMLMDFFSPLTVQDSR